MRRDVDLAVLVLLEVHVYRRTRPRRFDKLYIQVRGPTYTEIQDGPQQRSTSEPYFYGCQSHRCLFAVVCKYNCNRSGLSIAITNRTEYDNSMRRGLPQYR